MKTELAQFRMGSMIMQIIPKMILTNDTVFERFLANIPILFYTVGFLVFQGV